MTYTVLIAPESLQAHGFTHVVAFTEGRKQIAAFANNDLASQFSDMLNTPPKAETPKAPINVGVNQGLTLQQKIDAARASTGS